MCIHECGIVNINEFEKYRRIYLDKYIKEPIDNNKFKKSKVLNKI